MAPILTEEQKNCDHDFKDVTEERIALVEKRGLPRWAEILVEKEDPKWRELKDKYKNLKYLKCRLCGLLYVKG